MILCCAEASPDLANPEVLPLLRGAWLNKLSPVLHRDLDLAAGATLCYHHRRTSLCTLMAGLAPSVS